jgi:hypothetical protein
LKVTAKPQRKAEIKVSSVNSRTVGSMWRRRPHEVADLLMAQSFKRG